MLHCKEYYVLHFTLLYDSTVSTLRTQDVRK